MSRLASFRGPSASSASPVRAQQSPHSPYRSTESTFHRKVRTLLQELRGIAQTWDDLVLIDGLKAVQSLIDTRTELDDAIALIPPGQLQRAPLVGPKLEVMEKRIAELDTVVSKLQAQFRRMNTVVDSMDAVLSEAHKLKGWQWVHEEPLWVTWPLEKFVSSVPDILIPYHRSLYTIIELVENLRSHSVSFEDSREAMRRWTEQPWLEAEGWDTKWEDLCAVEVERWDRPG